MFTLKTNTAANDVMCKVQYSDEFLYALSSSIGLSLEKKLCVVNLLYVQTKIKNIPAILFLPIISL